MTPDEARQRAVEVARVVVGEVMRAQGYFIAPEKHRNFAEQVVVAYEAALWQPIETAPRDGTVVDLCVDGERWTDCYWGLPDHCCGEAGQYCDSDWHSLAQGWVSSAYNEMVYTAPTHWRPLLDGPGDAT